MECQGSSEDITAERKGGTGSFRSKNKYGQTVPNRQTGIKKT